MLSFRNEAMSDISQCPECGTRFRVNEEQLSARDGLVRCGRCDAVFNARDHLIADEPSPQLNLPIWDDPASEAAPSEDAAPEHFIGAELADLSPAAAPDQNQAADLAGLEEAPLTLAQQVQMRADDAPDAPPPRSRRAVAWSFGILLLLLLLAQATYFYRNELALRLPGLKPLLQSACEPLSCTIDLPHDADLLAIESSELEADARLPSVFTLHVLLRNQAAYAQALPSLELTLTDLQEKMIARRLIHPADYRRGLAGQTDALAPKRELALALHLETAELRPTGYRLLLFYPPQP